MTEKSVEGVTIGDASNFVRLLYRAGPRDEDGMTSVDIEIKAGPFYGAVRDETLMGVTAFREALSSLYETLRGEATLSSYEKFNLSIKGNGQGGIWANVELYGSHFPLSKVCFEFGFDQTFIPKIIKELQNQFPVE